MLWRVDQREGLGDLLIHSFINSLRLICYLITDNKLLNVRNRLQPTFSLFSKTPRTAAFCGIHLDLSLKKHVFYLVYTCMLYMDAKLC